MDGWGWGAEVGGAAFPETSINYQQSCSLHWALDPSGLNLANFQIATPAFKDQFCLSISLPPHLPRDPFWGFASIPRHPLPSPPATSLLTKGHLSLGVAPHAWNSFPRETTLASGHRPFLGYSDILSSDKASRMGGFKSELSHPSPHSSRARRERAMSALPLAPEVEMHGNPQLSRAHSHEDVNPTLHTSSPAYRCRNLLAGRGGEGGTAPPWETRLQSPAFSQALWAHLVDIMFLLM